MRHFRLFDLFIRTIFCVCIVISVPEFVEAQALPTGTWTKVPTHGFPVQVVGWEKLVYSATTQRMTILSDYHSNWQEPNRAFMSYDFASNRWDILDIGGRWHNANMPDGGHQVGHTDWDSTQGVYIIHCCSTGTFEPENPQWTYWYDPVGMMGRAKLTSPKPGHYVMEGTAAFDPVAGKFLLHTAFDWWSYTPSTNTWASITPIHAQEDSGDTFNPGVTSISLASMRYNSTDGLIYMFGGRVSWGGSTGNVYYNDLYTYNFATNTLTLVHPSTAKPSGRQEAGFAYDSNHNIFLLYGGNNNSGGDLGTPQNDTWTFDPVTKAWTDVTSSVGSIGAVFGLWERLEYDPAHNAFVALSGVSTSAGYADGTWTSLSTETWMLRLTGTGTNPGASSFTPPTVPAGSNNRVSTGYANEPAIASDGTNVFVSHVETSAPYDQSSAYYPRIYADKFASGTWSNLGSSYNSITGEGTGGEEWYSPQAAYIAGTPWVTYHSREDGFHVKSWSSGAWAGIAIPPVIGTNGIGKSSIVGIGSTPFIAFVENDKTFGLSQQHAFVYVKSVSGGTSSLVGSGALNRTSGITVADSVAIASDGTHPWVTWTEYNCGTAVDWCYNPTKPQVYVAEFISGSWSAVGGSLNNDTTNGWAFDATIAWHGGQPYVAWTERTQSGAQKLYVKTYSSGAWSLVGSGDLNKDGTTGWATRPALATDGSGNLYLGWTEQQAIGQKPKAWVSKWNSGAWSAVGSSLNMSSNGAAQRISLAVAGGQPVAGFEEVQYGTTRQVYARQWDGVAAWGAVGAAPTAPSTTNTLTIKNTGSTTSNMPIQIGRPFVQGEIPSGQSPQVWVGATAVSTQVDVKERWPDNSLKHGVLSFMIPTFTSSTNYAITIAPGTTAGNTALTKSQMLDAAYDFDAVISLTKSGVTKTASARTMLNNGDYTVWASGPVATTVVIAHHGQGFACVSGNASGAGAVASKYDFGFDAFCPFRPVFIATFWPTTHQVQVRFAGELVNTEQFEDVPIDTLTLTTGSASPATVYTQSSFVMFGGSRWTKTFWIGGTPPVSGTNHNIAYLGSTMMMPNFDPSKTPSDSSISDTYSAWVATSRNLYDAGRLLPGMPTPANRNGDEIGPYPGPVMEWLYTGDYRLEQVSREMVELSGAWPMNFREGATGKFLDQAHTVNAIGHPLSVASRPTINFANDIVGHVGQPDALAPVGSVGFPLGWTERPLDHIWIPDAAHQPQWMPVYLVTGDYYYLEQNMFWASWTTGMAYGFATSDEIGRGPTGKEGHMSSFVSVPYQIRGQGWGFKSRVETAATIPDSMPEKAYFEQHVLDAIAGWEGERNITTSPFHGNAMWNWANQFASSTAGFCDRVWCIDSFAGVHTGVPSAIHFWIGGSSGFNDVPESNSYIATGASMPTWEVNVVTFALARAKELGYPTTALLNWVAPAVISQMTDPGYNPYLSGSFRTPTKDPATGQYFTTWAQVKARMCASLADGCYADASSQTATTFDPPVNKYFLCAYWPGGDGVCAAPYYAGVAVSHLTDQPNGAAAWSFINAAAMTNASLNDNPKFSILPRTVTPPTCSLLPATAGPYTAGQTTGFATFVESGCSGSTYTTTGLGSSGLTLNSSTGALSGTAVAGTYSATVSYDTASVSFTLTINAAPMVANSGALTAGTQGAPYSFGLTINNGTGAATCAVVTGALPTSTSFSGCTISGTPSVAGTFTFTVHATDANGITGATSSSMSITIGAGGSAPTITTTSPLPQGTVGGAYSVTFAATGTPTGWSATSAPPGLSLSSGGVLSGTPTVPATSTINVTATNAFGSDGPHGFSLTINAAPTITTSGALPSGNQSVPYSQALSTSGGTGSVTCAVTSGSLPAGLSFSGCTISGTPSGAGTSTFTAAATDSLGVTGSASSSLSILINGLIVGPGFTVTGASTGIIR